MSHHRTLHARMSHGLRHARRPRTIPYIARVTIERFLLIPIGALIALVWANTASESYFVFASRASFWVNEIGMTLFFALLAQETYEATMPGGALHSWRRWSMPIVAAAGGIVGSAAAF